MKAAIEHISYYLPEKKISNQDFFQLFNESVKNIDNLLKIGIEERHVVDSNQTASDIAVKAAEKLFLDHSINRTEIDFVLFCAQEFDYYTPTTACVIHDRLKLSKHCGALDFNLGCSGYVYGLSLAKGLIEGVGLKKILLLTSSTLTKTFHPKDKSSHFLFGDGSSATLIIGKDGNDSSIGEFVFGTDGNGVNKIIIKDGGGRNALTENSYVEIEDDYGNVTNNASFYMNGISVFVFGLNLVPKMVNEILRKEKKSIQDIDLFIFHQANLFLIEKIRLKLDIPEDKIFNFMKDVGNTVSSSIPIALNEAIKCGAAKKGDVILLAGFGVGLSWAATIITL